MYYQKRGALYSFIYYDSALKKNVRLSRVDVPFIRSDEEAKAFCQKWDRKRDAIQVRIRKRLRWKEKFHNFNNLLELYERIRKEEAPHSWEADGHYLEYYIFPFFLELKEAQNLDLWSDYFEEFRDHLLTVKTLKRKSGNTLSYATKNIVIKVLNTFLLLMYRRREVDKVEKCRYFPKHKLHRKGEESVLSREMQKRIKEELQKKNQIAAFFFQVSLNTGLRFNEQLGLSLADFFPGEIEERSLRKILDPYQFLTLGYLAIESQPLKARSPRDPSGRVFRKPLKSKKRISHEEGRVIPLFEKETFNILVCLWNRQQLLFLERKFGKNPKDYLLFEGLNKNIYSGLLRNAQKSFKEAKVFTPQDSRHTFATRLADETSGNYVLSRLILGHTDLSTTLRYIHLSAQIHKNLKLEAQLSNPMKSVGE